MHTTSLLCTKCGAQLATMTAPETTPAVRGLLRMVGALPGVELDLAAMATPEGFPDGVAALASAFGATCVRPCGTVVHIDFQEVT
jgi:hypothetical protein